MSTSIRSRIHASTETLRGFGWYFVGLSVAIFAVLLALCLKGVNVEWAFLLSFMWLFGIALSIDKAHQFTAPESSFGVGAYAFHISVGVITWGVILFVTIKFALGFIASDPSRIADTAS